MRKRWRFAIVLVTGALAWESEAQVLNDGFGNYRLTSSGGAPRNFTIGNAFVTGAGSALNVRGDQLGIGNTTGEVFRTDAPNANSTYWRMFRGGIQYGLLYNLTGSNDFNAQVLPTAGNLWLRNSLSNGLRLNAGTLTTTIGTYSPTISNFVGIGPGTGIIGTQGAWARLHLDDGGLLNS